MHRPATSRCVLTVSGAFALTLMGMMCLTTGCRHHASVDPARSRLTAIATLYCRFQIAHHGALPQNESQLREFIDSYPNLPEVLHQARVAVAEELFVSERNGQPFVLLFGDDANRREDGIIAYERGPVDDRRMVGYRAGFARALDETVFQEASSTPTP
jgi:hypothetical protein